MTKRSKDLVSEEAQMTGCGVGIFPEDSAQLEAMLAASESSPLSECVPMVVEAARIREIMGW